MTGVPRPLEEGEAELVEAVWRRGGEGITSRRLQGVGCGLAFVGMLALTLTPALANYVEVSPASAYGVLALAVVLLILGAALGIVGSSRAEPARPGALDEAVARLLSARDASDADPVAEAALVLLRLREAGPGVDGAELGRRLGPVADVVRRVEAHLVQRGLLPPPSTRSP